MNDMMSESNIKHIPELSDLANEFIAKAGNDWNRYLWKISKAKTYTSQTMAQIILNEAIDILRPHLDKYNTPERMVGEDLWRELAAYTGIEVPPQ